LERSHHRAAGGRGLGLAEAAHLELRAAGQLAREVLDVDAGAAVDHGWVLPRQQDDLHGQSLRISAGRGILMKMESMDAGPPAPKLPSRRRAVTIGLVLSILALAIGIGVTGLARWSRVPSSPILGGSRIRLGIKQTGPTKEGTTGQIVFARALGGRYHLYLMNSDGTDEIALTSGITEERTPEWSPQRDRIAFARFAEPGGSIADLYVMLADGSGLKRLTNGPEVEEDPSWSPDGERIVFTASDRSTGRTRIRILRVDGGRSPQLPDPPDGCIDREPAWSPDGASIAFARKCGDAPSSLDVIRADGSGLRLLDDFGRTPDWSPNGSKIAFTGWGRYGPAIFIVNNDGSELVQLTTDGTADPAWSPDGSRIAFTGGGLALRLFVIDTDGKNQRLLTDDTSDQVMPTW
jgi:Tol biopolymer transport system component